jgi:hypothetical protein
LLLDPPCDSRRYLLNSGSNFLFARRQFICITVLIFDGPLMRAGPERK